MSKKDIDVSVADLGNYYKVDINKDGENMSGGMIAGIIIGFLLFIIVGVILLIVWASKINKNNIHISFNLDREFEINCPEKRQKWGIDIDLIKQQLLLKKFSMM